MVIGKMDKIVRFDKNVPVPATAGFTDVYATLLTTHGYMEKKSGNRSLSFGEVLNENTYDLWIHYQQALEDNLQSDVKIVYEEKVFTIQTWEKIKEKRFYYHFVLTETGRISDNSSYILIDMPLYLTGVENENSVQDDNLVDAQIFLVLLESIVFEPVSGTPGEKEVQYDSEEGELIFPISFVGSPTIYVLYKS